MITVRRIETTHHDEETGRQLGHSVGYQVERDGRPVEGSKRLNVLDLVRPEWREETK